MRKRTTIAAKIFLALAIPTLPGTAFGLDPHRPLATDGRQSWQTDQGLPQNTVRAVLQTRDGYLWLATDGGLVRFDGVRFVVYDKQSTPGLRSNSVNSLFEDRAGDLWIGTADGLTRRRGSEFTTFTSAADDGARSNEAWSVYSVYQDRGGTLWALTSEGLAGFSNGRITVSALHAGLSSSSTMVEADDGSLWIGTVDGVAHLKDGQPVAVPTGVTHLETQTLAATGDGRIWIGTRAGLQIVAAGSVTTLNQQQGMPADEVLALLPDARGRMWVGTAGGLVRFNFGRTAPTRVFGTADGLPGEVVRGLYADRDNAIWVSTNKGAARVLPDAVPAGGTTASGRIEPFTRREGLSGNSVLAMYEDREGSLWLGTESGGLSVLHDQKFTAYTAASGLSEDLVRSVFEDRHGALWAGTNGGGLDRVPTAAGGAPGGPESGRPGANFSTENGLSSNIVLALADDREGDLWVGTPDGLNRLKGGRATVYTSADGLADDFVRSLYTAPDDSLWIGTRRGLSHLAKGRFTSYSSMDGLGSNLVGALLQESNPGHEGALWIGTLGGLSRLENGKFTNYTTRDGLSSNIVTALYEDAAGAMWIGTDGGGLNRLRNGSFTRFAPGTTGLPENIYSIVEDGKHSLWLSSDKGIYRVALSDLGAFAAGRVAHLMPAVYGTADGMAIAECSSGGHPSSWRLRDGSLAFATLRGVAMIDPARAPMNTRPPPVAIEQVAVDDRPLDPVNGPGGALDVAPGQGRVAIEYTAMSFLAPQKVHFRYKLEGFDHAWTDAGARRTAYYTNLPPGAYTFRVVACNNDGVWNDAGATLHFRLRPHFYQTWLFDLALALLLLALAALAGYVLYQRRLQRVESQFGAVLAERGRIAREIHDTLAQGLVAISTQLEIVARLLPSSTEMARHHLDEARTMTRASLTEARASIWDLRSQGGVVGAGVVGGPADGGDDLPTRLSKMAATATAATSIKIQSKVGGAYRPLPARVESELLRIAQEAVVNAVRHADPRHIIIELRFDPDRLRMTIQDDGRGFSGQPHPQSSGPDGHFGLTGMRERAAQIGGTLSIDSARGKGTTVLVEAVIPGS